MYHDGLSVHFPQCLGMHASTIRTQIKNNDILGGSMCMRTCTFCVRQIFACMLLSVAKAKAWTGVFFRVATDLIDVLHLDQSPICTVVIHMHIRHLKASTTSVSSSSARKHRWRCWESAPSTFHSPYAPTEAYTKAKFTCKADDTGDCCGACACAARSHQQLSQHKLPTMPASPY